MFKTDGTTGHFFKKCLSLVLSLNDMLFSKFSPSVLDINMVKWSRKVWDLFSPSLIFVTISCNAPLKTEIKDVQKMYKYTKLNK